MEQIIDIAKQTLDTYKSELYAVGVLNNLTEDDYKIALKHITQLKEELEEMIEGK